MSSSFFHGLSSRNPSHGVQSEVSDKTSTSKKCSNCLKHKDSNKDMKLFACGDCKKVMYCGRACQKEHWKRIHKHQCKKSST